MENLTDYSWWCTVAVGLLVFIIVCVKHNVDNRHRGSHAKDLSMAVPVACQSPQCVRCRLRKTQKLEQSALAELEKLVKSEGIERTDLERIYGMAQLCTKGDSSTSNQNSTFHDMPVDSMKAESVTKHPLWIVDGLTSKNYWSKSEVVKVYPQLHELLTQECLDNLRSEYNSIRNKLDGWKTNIVPNGTWKTYYLVNQGQYITENCQNCPALIHHIHHLNNSLMIKNSYGNVFFSVLECGSEIEPHYGPCNFRLRLHIPLYTTNCFHLCVNRETRTWKLGEALIFDDSFLHGVCYSEEPLIDSQYDSNKELAKGGTCEVRIESKILQHEMYFTEGRERVVLILDLWHPDLTDLEKQSLDYMFSPSNRLASAYL